ncbi:hypothetical protein BAE44_0023709 [Dichanthelium oligosanthes]|uniref:NB-ARC domain-containing protein n=1 Tax=Dichanthelium oligosanthes TaxID=888268 RepID=A0A1E5UQU7_9POAL|nr:hypothetical protein BAE44_0023709 [Dichanthelium oligosanthes]
MDGVMVSVVTGETSSLFTKFATLLEKKYKLNKGVKEIISLRDEMSSMNALLMKLSRMEELDEQQEWRDKVRELSYDMEDCIDIFFNDRRGEFQQKKPIKFIPSEKIKVISVVGLGGVGKTTLAHQVYSMVKCKFDCTAFVSASQNPNMVKIFSDILSGVGCSEPSGLMDECKLNDLLKEHLKDKRYAHMNNSVMTHEKQYISSCMHLPLTVITYNFLQKFNYISSTMGLDNFVDTSINVYKLKCWYTKQ